jgi:hypothetical protein
MRRKFMPTSEFFLSLAQQPNANQGRRMRFRDHTQWHTTVGRTHLDEEPARRWDLCMITQDTHKRHVQASDRIRTRDPSNQAAVDPCFRPYGYRNQPTDILDIHNYQSFHVKIKLVVVSYSGGNWFQISFRRRAILPELFRTFRSLLS